MKMTLPLSLGAVVALCLAYLHLAPAPQDACSASSTASTGGASFAIGEKSACCTEGAACCQEGAACCVASATGCDSTKCCSAGEVCGAGAACCATAACDCSASLQMPVACDPSMRDALIIAGDLARFVDQEISVTSASATATISEILPVGFWEITDGFGTATDPLQSYDYVLPKVRADQN